MEKKILCCFFLVFQYFFINGQIDSNIIYTNTINTAFVQEIGKQIGDKQIVLLGEQDHGDATAFQVKTDLIKYLHEQKGFSVLVFESDFWSINQAWEQNDYSELRKNITNVWSQCNATDSLFEYVNNQVKSNHPLILQGMDCNHFQPFSKSNYMTYLEKQMRKEPFFQNNEKNLERFLFEMDRVIKEQTFVPQTWKDTLNASSKTFLLACLDSLISTSPNNEWKQEYKNCKGLLEFRWEQNLNKRDETMASNLFYLIQQKYPNEKIIVWAHNLHISKNIPSYQKQTVGKLLNEIIPEQIYAIGFISGSGNFRRYNTENIPIKVPKSKTIEKLLLEKNFNYAYYPLMNHFDFLMSGVFHNNFKKYAWYTNYDAVLFIKEMHGCN